MQLYLSNLVDLALGKPHSMNCENYNFLHILLHVMLKKLNIADSRIELTTELASKAGRIVNTLPRDPSLCFKEYTLRAGGGKIRKKNTNFISPKKSLIQINRKWPQCCHSTSSSSTSSSSTCDNCSIDSIKVLKEIKSSENDNEVERILRDLNKRISQLEHEQKRQIEIQNQINHTAMQEFLKLKSDCMEIINDVRKSSSIEITTSKNNVGKEIEIVDPIHEINWLKERMLDISESLKLHSECLRKFKCDELPKIKSSQEELCNSLQTLKYQVIRRLESEKAAKIKESKFEIESLKQQMISVSSQIREVEKNLETCKQSTSNEMLTLRNEFVDKIKDQMSVTSEIIKIENLECPSSKNNLKKDFEMDNDNLQVNSYTCMCPNVTSSIFDIKKQVSSQSICMQQLVRDLSMKLDRCEFQVYCHEINDTIECLMQLKNDICSTPMAAGASIPLLRNVNCISCQTTANMKITESTVPKLRPIKGSQDQDNSTCISCCNKTISDANWSCYTQKSGRARAMSRLKCRKTPFRSCGSPILIYKNRFRKHCC